MEEFKFSSRRKSMAQTNLKLMRDVVKCSLSIQAFSAGLRPHASTFDNFFEAEKKDDCYEKHIYSSNFFHYYEEIKYLGQGGQSLIKKVRRKEDGMEFAIKIYKLKEIEDFEQMNLILKEFLNAKSLNHENIVKTYDLFTDPVKKEVIITMEHLKMKTLDYYLKKEHKFCENEVAGIAFKLLRALIFMHSKGICHRDINPNNIMIDKDFKTLKIIDFGVSKNFSEISRKNRKFVKKSVAMFTNVGTLIYSAPEILFGDGYSNDVDLWSLGVIVYQLLYGFLPFYSEYSGDLTELIINSKVEYPIKSDISHLAKDFCSKLLRKSSENRLNALEAMRHPFILNNVKISIEKNIPTRSRQVEKFRTQIFKHLESQSLIAIKIEKQNKKIYSPLIQSFKKFSANPKKKFPIMKIKGFPPFLLQKGNHENFQANLFNLKTLHSTMSIENILEDQIFSVEEFAEFKKKIGDKSNGESQNLITSNLL